MRLGTMMYLLLLACCWHTPGTIELHAQPCWWRLTTPFEAFRTSLASATDGPTLPAPSAADSLPSALQPLACSAYRLPVLTLQDAFAKSFFQAHRRGQLPLYRDAQLQTPWLWAELEAEAFYLSYLLSSEGERVRRMEASADILPEYRIHLYQSADSSLPVYCLELLDQRKPLLPPYRLYCAAAALSTLPLQELKPWVDYNGVPGLAPAALLQSGVLREARYCSDALGEWQLSPPQISTEAPAASVAYELDTCPTLPGLGGAWLPYSFALPARPEELSYRADALGLRLGDAAQNRILFQRCIPQLWRQVLSGKLKLYHSLRHTVLKPKSLLAKLKGPEGTATKGAKGQPQPDYSEGLSGLEVRAQAQVLPRGLNIRCEALALVWQDPKRAGSEENLGYVKLEDVRRRKLRFQGLELAQWLAQRSAWGYTLQLNDAYPQTLEEALSLELLLRQSGTMIQRLLMPQARWQHLQPDILHELRMLRPRVLEAE